MTPSESCPSCGDRFPGSATSDDPRRCPGCGSELVTGERAARGTRGTPRSARGPARRIPVWVPVVGVTSLVLTLPVVLVLASGSSPHDVKPRAAAGPAPAAAPQAPDPGPPQESAPDGPPQGDPGPANAAAIPAPPTGADRPTLVLDAGGHTGAVERVFLTPDDARAVTVSRDKTVRLWDLASGQTLRTIRPPVGPGTEGALDVAALSPDGKRLAVAGVPVRFDGREPVVYLIALEDGRIERAIRGPGLAATSLAFSPDGRRLAVGRRDKTVTIYGADDGAVLGRLEGHGGAVTALAFHPTDGTLAALSEDRRLWLWRPSPKGGWTSTDTECYGTSSAAWRPDGELIVCGGPDGRIWMFTKEGKNKGCATGVFQQYDGWNDLIPASSLTYTPDGKRLLYTGYKYRPACGVYDFTAGRLVVEFPGHTGPPRHASLSRDGKIAVSAGDGEPQALVWRTADGTTVHPLGSRGRAVYAVGWSRDGKAIQFGNTSYFGNSEAVDWQNNLGFLERSFDLDALEFGPGPAKGVASYRALGRLDRYEVRTVRHERHVQVLRDGRLVCTLHPDGPAEEFRTLSLFPGDRLLAGTWSGRLLLYDIRTEAVEREFTGHAGCVTAIAPGPDRKLFLSGSTDQTIRVWSVDRTEPILTLFPAGGQWVAWTPEGYYAASAGGERLMGWQVNNGPDRVGTLYPAGRFRNPLHQPAVIRGLVPAGGDLARAVAAAAREGNRPPPTIEPGQSLPPVVEVTAPAVGSTGEVVCQEPTLRVTATARGRGRPVRSLRLLLDGRPYGGPSAVKAVAPSATREASAEWDIVVPAGRHTINVLADTGASKGLSDPVELVRRGPARLPNLYVFAVGISDYPGGLKLNYAAADARSIAAVFREKTKTVFGSVDVKVVTDRDGTKEAILGGLDWLNGKMTWEDVGVFFFSGHGGRDGGDGRLYLVPHDFADDLAASGVPGDAVRDRLAALPGRVLAIFDACHSGAVGGSLKVANVDGLARELLSDEYGVVVLASSPGDGVSFEGGKLKGGFFTTSLVEGLNGKADLDGDGVVWLHELAIYGRRRVLEVSHGLQTTVTGRPPNVRTFPLSRPRLDP